MRKKLPLLNIYSLNNNIHRQIRIFNIKITYKTMLHKETYIDSGGVLHIHKAQL